MVLPTLDETGKVCRQPLEMLFVRWNGQVMGCCSAVFDNDDYNFHIGSILDADPVELWNCEKMRRYRRAVFFGEEENLPKNCRACAFRHDNPESHWRFLDA